MILNVDLDEKGRLLNVGGERMDVVVVCCININKCDIGWSFLNKCLLGVF